METPDILNSKSLKGFIKGSFVIVGLFVVLSFGFATLVLLFAKNHVNNLFYDWKIFLLILVLTNFPIIVFLIVFSSFHCFVKKKLCVSSCNKYERSLLKIHEIKPLIEVCHMVVKARNMIKKNIRRRC